MAQPLAPERFCRRTPQDRTPAVEVAVGPPVARLQLIRTQLRRQIDHVARVVAVPAPARDAARGLHAGVQGCARVGRENVKRRRLDALLDGPIHRAVEHVGTVVVHAEDEACVDHHPEVVEASNRRGVVAVEVLNLVLIA